MNIYDIAKLSGVSIATVSRVVNGSSKVSEKTKAKVLEVLDSSGYTPNIFARGLGLGTMKTIGIICPDISDVFMAEAISFLERDLKFHGYSCIVGCSGHELASKMELTRFFISKKIDALILVGSTYAENGEHDSNTDYLRELSSKTPVFLINAFINGEHIYCSVCNDFEATYDLTEKLIKNGRKRILFLYDSTSHSAGQKMAGYKAALGDAGIPILEELILLTKDRIQYTKELLLIHSTLEFDAILAIQDTLAIGAIKYAHIAGKSIPEDLCITGYNNSRFSISCEPELTSIDNHLDVLCQNTITTILKILDGEDDVKKVTQINADLIERASTNIT